MAGILRGRPCGDRTHEEGYIKMKAEISYAVTSQGTPRIAGSHQKLGRGKEGVFSWGFRRHKALLTPSSQTSSFQNHEPVSLFQATQCVVLRYSSPRKLTHTSIRVLKARPRNLASEAKGTRTDPINGTNPWLCPYSLTDHIYLFLCLLSFAVTSLLILCGTLAYGLDLLICPKMDHSRFFTECPTVPS